MITYVNISIKPIRKIIMSLLARHPIITFSLGVAAGYLIHKYRKEIIDAGNAATEKSKEFVLHQKENLGDILAETKEGDEPLTDA
jgi:hypothetical protein